MVMIETTVATRGSCIPLFPPLYCERFFGTHCVISTYVLATEKQRTVMDASPPNRVKRITAPSRDSQV